MLRRTNTAQDKYYAWLDSLPDNHEESRSANKLQAIAKIDLEELPAINRRAATATTDRVVKPLDRKSPIQACPREGGGAAAGGGIPKSSSPKLPTSVRAI